MRGDYILAERSGSRPIFIESWPAAFRGKGGAR